MRDIRAASRCEGVRVARGRHGQISPLTTLPVDGPEPDPECHRFLRNGTPRAVEFLRRPSSGESLFRKAPQILDVFLGPSTRCSRPTR
jgi:hypothetical protein